MAKFSRYDPRNKKQGRNKAKTLNRDIKIKNPVKNTLKPTGRVLPETYTDEVDEEETTLRVQ